MSFCDPNPEFFYDEISSIQPDYDLLVDDYTGPRSLAGPLLNRKVGKGCDESNYEIPDNYRDIQMVEDIHTTESSNYDCIGRRRTAEDLENGNAREIETLIMLRNAGFESSRNERFNSKFTYPTLSSNKKYSLHSKMPILLDAAYFELKPIKSNSSNLSGTSNSGSSNDSSSSGCEIPYQKLITETNAQSSNVLINLQNQKRNRNYINHSLGTSLITNQLESCKDDKKIEKPKICNPKYLTPKEVYLKNRNSK